MTSTSPTYGSIAWLKPGALDSDSMDVFAMMPKDVRLQVFALPLSTAMMEAEAFDGSGFDAVQRRSCSMSSGASRSTPTRRSCP
jgi:hypothetical protein